VSQKQGLPTWAYTGVPGAVLFLYLVVHKSADTVQQSAQLTKPKHGSLEIHIVKVCKAGVLERSPREGFDPSLLPPLLNDTPKLCSTSQTCQQNPDAKIFFQQDLQVRFRFYRKGSPGSRRCPLPPPHHPQSGGWRPILWSSSWGRAGLPGEASLFHRLFPRLSPPLSPRLDDHPPT
jgi:hypothetical protein